jgi:hypothetical protein
VIIGASFDQDEGERKVLVVFGIKGQGYRQGFGLVQLDGLILLDYKTTTKFQYKIPSPYGIKGGVPPTSRGHRIEDSAPLKAK